MIALSPQYGGLDYAGLPIAIDVPGDTERLTVLSVCTALEPEVLTGIKILEDSLTEIEEHITDLKNGFTSAARAHTVLNPPTGEISLLPQGNFGAKKFCAFVVLYTSSSVLGPTSKMTKVTPRIASGEAYSHTFTTDADNAMLFTWATCNASSSSIDLIDGHHVAVGDGVLPGQFDDQNDGHVGRLFVCQAGDAGDYVTGAKFTTNSNREGALMSFEISGSTDLESDVEVSAGAKLLPLVTDVEVTPTDDDDATISCETTRGSGTISCVVDEDGPSSVEQTEAGENAGGETVVSGKRPTISVSSSGAQSASLTGLTPGVTYWLSVSHDGSQVESLQFTMGGASLIDDFIAMSHDGFGYCS